MSLLFKNGHAAPEDFHEVHEHVSPVSLYVKVLGSLFVLTGLTYAVSYANLGSASLAVAMFVAFMKATLVCMFFMHLKYDDRYHVFVFLSSLIFVSIFFTFVIFDLQSRPILNEEQETFYRWRYDEANPPSSRLPEHMPEEGHGDAPSEHGVGH